MFALLLPPSEGKAPGGDGPGWSPDSGRFGALGAHRRRVADALADLGGGHAKLLGAKGDLLDRARAANGALVDAATLPAWRRFTGVVWDALGPTTLSREARRRARSSVIVVSAVTGLTGWSDPTPDFRLKLSANLPPLGRLDRYWHDPVSALLDQRLARRTVIDLLPNEHRGACTVDATRCELIRPVFTGPDGKPGGHHAKQTKGRLARALLESDDPVAALHDFDAAPLTLTLPPAPGPARTRQVA